METPENREAPIPVNFEAGLHARPGSPSTPRVLSVIGRCLSSSAAVWPAAEVMRRARARRRHRTGRGALGALSVVGAQDAW